MVRKEVSARGGDIFKILFAFSIFLLIYRAPGPTYKADKRCYVRYDKTLRYCCLTFLPSGAQIYTVNVFPLVLYIFLDSLFYWLFSSQRPTPLPLGCSCCCCCCCCCSCFLFCCFFFLLDVVRKGEEVVEVMLFEEMETLERNEFLTQVQESERKWSLSV